MVIDENRVALVIRTIPKTHGICLLSVAITRPRAPYGGVAEPCNWYSKFLHEHTIDHKCYGFCYDDSSEQAAYFSDKADTLDISMKWDGSALQFLMATAMGRSRPSLWLPAAVAVLDSPNKLRQNRSFG